MKTDWVVLWGNIKKAGGLPALSAFNKVWYKKELLGDSERVLMNLLYEQFPLNEPNFNAWLRQRTRQVYENAVKAQMEVEYAGENKETATVHGGGVAAQARG